MRKIIRPTYPLEISIGILILIFALSFFLSSQVFNMSIHNLLKGGSEYFGMFLVSIAVVIMLLILWEELLFPVKVKLIEGGAVFRNHRTKLKIQALIYLTIPVIFCFVYFKYDINQLRFFIWAAICVITPVAGKLISGINNYNDFLKLTHDTIEYKNNEKAGVIEVKNILQITLLKDETNVLHKIQLQLIGNNQLTIDLDEMELSAFFDSIDKFMTSRYERLLKLDVPVA